MLPFMLPFMLTPGCYRCMPLSTGDLDVDRQALLQLYNSTGGVSWVDNAGWSTNDANLSNWDGLTLNGSVVWGIHLEGNNLKGKCKNYRIFRCFRESL